MTHVRDFEYRGHEVIILKDGNKYACDIREDNGQGNLIDGFYDFDTEAEAVM